MSPRILCLFTTLILSKSTQAYDIPIGMVYDQAYGLQDAVRLAVDQLSAKSRYLKLDPKQRNYLPPRQNAFYLEQDICTMMSGGIFGLFGFGQAETLPVMNAISQTFHVPFFNWNTPAYLSNSNRTFEINFKPPLHEVIADIVINKGWRNVSYIYDQPDDAISNLQRINDIIESKRNYTIAADLRKIDLENIYTFINNFQKSHLHGPQHVILDISTSTLQEKVLDQIIELSTRTRNFHYIAANYEFSQNLLNRFKVGLVNVTGFRLFNKELNRAYRAFLPSWKQSTGRDEIHAEEAFAYDSVEVFFKALDMLMNASHYRMLESNFRSGKMYNRDKPGLSCHNQDEQTATFEHGLTLARAVKQIKHEGISGHIQFDINGMRRAYNLEMVELSFSGKENMIAISSSSVMQWEEGKGFHGDGKVVEERNLKGVPKPNRTRIITTIQSEPFVMLKKSRENEELVGNDRFEGFCVDLMKLISQKMEGFHYEIRLVNDSKYGAADESGSWNGMVGELLRKEADMAVASLTITKARERVVDFSKPFLTLGISIMIKKPDKQEFSVFSFMSPLSSEIWMYIIFAYLGVSFVLFLVSRFSPYEWRVEETVNGFSISNDFSVYNCLWFTLAAFMQQGTDILPRSISGRVASSAWWFFTMIIVSSYTANLAAFLTLEKMQTPIESVEDLAKQTKIKYGIQGGGSTAEFFRDSSVETYSRMWSYMFSQQPSVFVKTYGEGIKRVRESKGRYAFLLESTANDYTNTRKPCDTMKVGQNLNSVGYGVATPFGSELRDKINLAILELQEKGELKKLENKWWYDRGQCEPGAQDSQSASLNLSKVAGIFYILIGGMVIAMSAAFGEFFYRSKLEARKSNRTLGESMKSQLDVLSSADKIDQGELSQNNHGDHKRL